MGTLSPSYRVGSVNFGAVDSFTFHHDDILSAADLLDEYRHDIQLPLCFYVLRSVHFLSILTSFVIAMMLCDDALWMALFGYLALTLFLSVFGFTAIVIEVALFAAFCHLSGWTADSVPLFGSILLFQMATHCILGVMDRGEHLDLGKTRCLRFDERTKSTLFLNARFALCFGNFELIPLLIGGHRATATMMVLPTSSSMMAMGDALRNDHESITAMGYGLAMVAVVWMTSTISFYIKYRLRFGQYFNAKKHAVHFALALYVRLFVVCSVLFKVVTVALCTRFVLLTDYEQEAMSVLFWCTLFVIALNVVIVLSLPFALSIHRKWCCGGRRGCIRWFVFCQI